MVQKNAMTTKSLARLCWAGKSPEFVTLVDMDSRAFSIPLVRDAKKGEAPAIIAIDKVSYVKQGTAYVLKRKIKKVRPKKKRR